MGAIQRLALSFIRSFGAMRGKGSNTAAAREEGFALSSPETICSLQNLDFLTQGIPTLADRH